MPRRAPRLAFVGDALLVRAAEGSGRAGGLLLEFLKATLLLQGQLTQVRQLAGQLLKSRAILAFCPILSQIRRHV